MSLATARNELPEGDNELQRLLRDSAATFARRITLYSIYVNADATVDFWYHDDDMFGGHGIFAVVNDEGIVERAEMAG